MDKKRTANALIAQEKAALEAWNQGNPSGYLEIYDRDITYFDPYHEKRIDGIESMQNLYESLRGQIRVDAYEMIDTHVEVSEEMAVLTYNLVSFSPEEVMRWNCTEVYRPDDRGAWKIIHNHWSLILPSAK